MADLVPIKIPPGMFRNGTEYESSGRWFDGNLVRWENGRMKPVGGWQQYNAGSAFIGIARGGIAWSDNNGFRYCMIGTHLRLYETSGGVFSDITPGALVGGRPDSILGLGYGSGNYGKESYGTVRTLGNLVTDAATWSFDTLGQTAVAVLTSDGKLWQFDPATGLLTQPVGSPIGNLAVMVTNEDYVLLLGAGGQGRKLQWPDIGTTTIWTPASTNSAGSIQLNSSSRCKAGARVGTQNIVWTDSDVHNVQYVGPPAIYGPVRIAEGCGLVGPNAYAVTDVAYWMSYGGFFVYNGQVQPLDCDVQDYIWRNVNWLQAAKIYAEINSRYNEVTWLFPSSGSIENNSYVTYNYKDRLWTFGINSTLGARTTWIDRSPFPLPLAVDPNGVVYEHETGFLADGATRVGQVFAQSGPAEIGNGDKVLYANLMVPDGFNTAAIQMTTKTRFAPLGPEVVTGPYSLVPNAEGYVPVRIVGRQAAVRIDAILDANWSIGKTRLKIAAGGGR